MIPERMISSISSEIHPRSIRQASERDVFKAPDRISNILQVHPRLGKIGGVNYYLPSFRSKQRKAANYHATQKRKQWVIIPFNRNQEHKLLHGAHSCWVYACVEVKKTDTFDEALEGTRSVVDRALAAAKEVGASAHVVIDIVATRTNIANGEPSKVAQALYTYIETEYAECVATCFIGLTDTASRRVGRDVYCPSEELSRRKYSFSEVDNIHMSIVEPREK